MARAVLLVWLFRAVAAFALAYPAARTVSAFLPQSPSADALLFAPGALHAFEAVRAGGRAIQASLEGSALVFLLVSLAALLPLTMALVGLLHPRETTADLVARATALLPPLIALGGATALSRAVGLAAIAGAASALAGSLESAIDERASDLLVYGSALVATLPLLALGIGHDLSRAAVIRHDVRARTAVVVALSTLRSAPRAALLGWAVPALASAGVITGAAWLTGALDVSRPGAWRVAAVAITHQAAVLVLVALRLRWLGRALTLVGPPPEAFASEPPRASLDDRAARSDAPGDPTPDPGA
jgi:hypothetical protein